MILNKGKSEAKKCPSIVNDVTRDVLPSLFIVFIHIYSELD